MKGRSLPIVANQEEQSALQVRWPEAVLALSDEERARSVRVGQDTVLLIEGARTRGFVRAVLRVPLGHPRAPVYGVFVEVARAAYAALKEAHAQKTPTQVWGTLATRLPYLEDAFGSEVEILEDGSELRPRIVSAKSTLLLHGPPVGARS